MPLPRLSHQGQLDCFGSSIEMKSSKIYTRWQSMSLFILILPGVLVDSSWLVFLHKALNLKPIRKHQFFSGAAVWQHPDFHGPTRPLKNSSVNIPQCSLGSGFLVILDIPINLALSIHFFVFLLSFTPSYAAPGSTNLLRLSIPRHTFWTKRGHWKSNDWPQNIAIKKRSFLGCLRGNYTVFWTHSCSSPYPRPSGRASCW